MIQVDNEQQAIDMILFGVPGIHIKDLWFVLQNDESPATYLVQRNGQQGTFTSALEAINFYNSTFNESHQKQA